MASARSEAVGSPSAGPGREPRGRRRGALGCAGGAERRQASGAAAAGCPDAARRPRPRPRRLVVRCDPGSRDGEDPDGGERPGFTPARHDDAAQRPDDRNVRHTIESLDSLSVDIARMIDHDAAAELWERYNRGERNVFTRRLYTMQGQKAFEEVRRRYKADREFHQTVDRYIGEFERLLNEVSRDDRGQVVARTYLTSETGKVYTMLAHAAGRFE